MTEREKVARVCLRWIVVDPTLERWDNALQGTRDSAYCMADEIIKVLSEESEK